MICTLLLLLVLHPAQQKDDEAQKVDPNVSLIQMFSKMLTLGSQLWDQIGRDQAYKEVSRIEGQAHSATKQKEWLQRDLEDGHVSQDSFDERTQDLKIALTSFSEALRKFAVEIKQNSPGDALSLQGIADNLIDSRLGHINRAEQLFKAGDPVAQKAAAAELAAQCGHELQTAANCLRLSIKDKKHPGQAECTDEALTKSLSCSAPN